MNKLASFFIAASAIVIILIYGQDLLIPFVLALLVWILIREIKSLLDKVKFIKEKLPSWIKSVITSGLLFGLMLATSKLLGSSINTLSASIPTYQNNVNDIVNQLDGIFHLSVIDFIKGQSGQINFANLLSTLLNSITGLLGNAFMVLLYVLFIFLEESNFDNKLKAMFVKENQYEQISTTLDRIEDTVTNYIGLKLLVSIITGLISYFILLFIGIDSPIFWAFLITVLNFIPVIGSLIGTLFPTLFCLLQFGDFSHPLMTLFFVGMVQVLVGNVLEPRLMGNSLNISPLVVIISLTFWGSIWGIAGMILSVPIMVIMVIVFSQFEGTKSVAVLLSEKGKI